MGSKPSSGRGTTLAAALVALGLLTASCSESTPPTDSQPATSTASDSPASEPAVSEPAVSEPAAAAKYDCLSDQQRQENFRELEVDSGGFTATVDAVEFGTGSVGVVLSHQSDGDLCQWVDGATALAEQGYHVIVPGYGLNHYVEYAEAAVAHLTEAGASSIVLIGASMGGTVSLATAAELDPAPAAVVSLSGPADFADLEVTESVGTLDMPLLFAVGESDAGFVEPAEELHAAAQQSSDSRLVVVPGESGHGVELLGEGSKVQQELDSFLQEYAPVD